MSDNKKKARAYLAVANDTVALPFEISELLRLQVFGAAGSFALDSLQDTECIMIAQADELNLIAEYPNRMCVGADVTSNTPCAATLSEALEEVAGLTPIILGVEAILAIERGYAENVYIFNCSDRGVDIKRNSVFKELVSRYTKDVSRSFELNNGMFMTKWEKKELTV